MEKTRPLMRRSRPAWLVKGKARILRESARASLWAQALGRASVLSRAPAIARARLVSPVVAGLLAALIVTPFAIGEGGRAALAAAVKDPASLLAQRSPGERAAGAMHSTKPARLASARTLPAPRERVLPAERVRAPEVPLADVPDTGLPVIDAPIEVADAMGVPPGAVPFMAPPFGPGMVIPGPGPGPNPGPGPKPDPDPPLPPIPEPATWAMLLAGFFGIGAALRWRGRGQLARQPAAT